MSMTLRKSLIGAIFSTVTLLMCGCGDNGTNVPIKTTTSLDLITGQWWVEIADDTTIKVIDTMGHAPVKTTTYSQRHRRYSVSSAAAGQNGGVDYVVAFVDTFVGSSGSVDSIKPGTMTLTEKDGDVTMMQWFVYSLAIDTFSYVPFALPLTAGMSWTTSSDSIDNAITLFTMHFRTRALLSGTAVSASGMLNYSFANSAWPCFSIHEVDISNGTLTLDSSVAGLGFQAGYQIGRTIGQVTRDIYFSPDLNLPMYTRTVTVRCDSTKAFLTVTADVTMYDTVKTTEKITAAYDPRRTPTDTLTN
jgi:hypothetical protein